MFNLFRLFDKKPASKDIAKDRLKLVLMSDKTKIDSKILEEIKTDLISVISRHLNVDLDAVEIEITPVENGSGGYSSALVASIPIKMD